MVSDQNKKITQITYNILNLPGVITVSGKGTIKYYYDAAGNKLRKRTTDITGSPVKTTTTTYIGGAVYQNDTLQFFGTPEDRMRSNTDSSGWVYDYFLKDHLGNTRMMITDDYNVASPILEANSYYPFGLQQKGIGLEAVGGLHNKRLYNKGSELQEDFELDYYDTHFRNLDLQIRRWWEIDPKCELNINPDVAENDEVQDESEVGGLESVSPYMSMGDDPILHNDPDGDCPTCFIGALVGAVVDYGEQVATNYVEGKSSPWTNNINLTSIGTAAVAGFVTSGGSVAENLVAKTAVKVGAAVINNTVEINTTTGVTVHKNVGNIIKNTAIDLAADKIAGKAAGKLEGKLSKVGITNAGGLSRNAKAILKATGHNVTRATKATVKAGIKATAKVAAKATESAIKATTNKQRQELKDMIHININE